MSILRAMVMAGGAPRITIVDRTINDTRSVGLGGASATYQLNLSGKEQSVTNTVGTTTFGDWIVPNSAAANYEVECVVNSGTVTGSSTGAGVWQALSSTRLWTRAQPAVGLLTSQITVSIRRIGTTTVLDSAVITLEAEGI